MADKAPTPKAGSSVRTLLQAFYALPIVCVLGIFGYLAYSRLTHQAPPVRQISAKPFATVALNGLTANLFTQGDTLRASGNDLFLEFRDPAGKLVDVGDVSLELGLKMPDVVIHSIGKVLRTATPGQYRTTLEPQMAGDWTAQITFTGPKGQGQASLPVKVK
ncbi:MAG: hypothetical protein ABSH38_04075 [Verrucomicrobiota bacterium]